jgi:hypothetical protein
MNNLSDAIERKFIDTIEVSEWQVETDSGWEDIAYFNKTIEYEVWEIQTESGLTLRGADNHIFIDETGNEIFLKDSYRKNLITSFGIDRVISVNKLDYFENMYDLTVDSHNHTYFTNKILSHNTTVAAGYLLWYAMFVEDSTILITSNKYDSAQEIMHRVRYAYESIPDHIRAGVKTYNKRSIDFDNGSRIVATTTTENTGRGMSLSLVYLDEFAFVEPNIAKEFWTSLSPTLSTGGKCIITSTPNTDEDQFAEIWFGANKMVDANGDEKDIGVNGFRPFMAAWRAHPDRDEEWAHSEMAALGEDRFLREHECCNGDTFVTVQDQNGNIFQISIENLFNKLKFQKQKEYIKMFDKYLEVVQA